jgi:hypothetical protein
MMQLLEKFLMLETKDSGIRLFDQNNSYFLRRDKRTYFIRYIKTSIITCTEISMV